MTKVYVVGFWHDYDRYMIHSIWKTQAQAEHEKALLIEAKLHYPEDVDIEEYDVN